MIVLVLWIKKIVTLVGDPWYMSATQKWNGDAYILNKKPINMHNKDM